MLNFPDFAPDVAAYNAEVSLVANNCIPAPNGYWPLPAGETRSSANAGSNDLRCVGAWIVQVEIGSGRESRHEIIASIGQSPQYFELYIDGTDLAKAAVVMRQAVSHFVAMVQYDDTLLFFGAVDVPQKISGADIDSSTATQDIGGTPPRAGCVARVGQFVVLGRTYDGSNFHVYRVHWSGFDDFESWTAGTDQSGFEGMDPNLGPVMAIVGGDQGIIMQRKGLTRMSYIGQPDIWDFDVIESAPGLVGDRAWVRVGQDIFYLADGGFYRLVNGVESVNISDNRVTRWFFDNLGGNAGTYNAESVAEDAYRWIVCDYDAATGTVWWAFPEPDATLPDPPTYTYNSKVIIYSIPQDKWSTADIPAQYIFADIPRFADDNLNNDRYMLRHSIGWVERALHQGANLADRMLFPTGTPMTATIETGYIFDEKSKLVVEEVRPIVEGGSTQLSLLTKEDTPNDSEATDGPYSPDASGKVDFHVEGRFHRIRATISGAWESAVGLIALMQKGESR